MRYGNIWKERRRLFQQLFNQGNVHKYNTWCVKEAKKLLSRILDNPDDYMKHIRLWVFPSLLAWPVDSDHRPSMTASTALGMTFGIDVKSNQDPYIVLAEDALHGLSKVTNVGSYLGTLLHWFCRPVVSQIFITWQSTTYHFVSCEASIFSVGPKLKVF